MAVIEKVSVSWTQFGEYVDILYDRLREQRFSRVIGISRGGLPFGVTMSHRLNLPFTAVGVSSYNNETHEQETLICDTPDVIFEGWQGSILICDDIADSGKTLKFLQDKICNNPKLTKITTATLYCKEASIIRPDYFVEITDRWIVFPWEVE